MSKPLTPSQIEHLKALPFEYDLIRKMKPFRGFQLRFIHCLIDRGLVRGEFFAFGIRFTITPAGQKALEEAGI